uniref:DNA-directed RNA polymerase n=1 Tax=Atractomorpha echinata TaxID=52677 RepID=A0A140GIQ3_9CHLO|nr:RNA polymerase beta subunit [Atractomorpha echinata]
MPWEGYNYEDAILISERLVYDDVYTSIHIERYEIETRETTFGMEKITRHIPDIDKSEICHLDTRGIIKIGTWVEEGTILVGKVTPTNKKYHSPYQKLLYTILEKEFLPTRDSSLRAPKGLKAKVIDIQVINTESNNGTSSIAQNVANLQLELENKNNITSKFLKKYYKKQSTLYKKWFMLPNINPSKHWQQYPKNIAANVSEQQHQLHQTKSIATKFAPIKNREKFLKNRLFNRLDNNLKANICFFLQKSKKIKLYTKSKPTAKYMLKTGSSQHNFKFPVNLNQSEAYGFFLGQKKKTRKSSSLLAAKNKPIQTVHIYLAEKRKIQMGDKMAGRHGNKGIVSQVLPRQDMPYLPDGTPIDMVLNPLGVPSRMNVGQIYECLLGLAGKYLGEYFRIAPFDEIYGAEASRSLVYSKLYEVRKKTGSKWVFNPNNPGKIYLYDGRTGESFDQAITVGQAYMLKLVHLVDDKIHARSTGPYSLVTQQPLRGRSKQGGQRLGEMEVWALEGYGAAFTLLEMLTIKSDDMTGRITLWSNIILNKEIYIGTPESFKVLVCELQALCLDIGLFRFDSKGFLKQVEHLMKLP